MQIVRDLNSSWDISIFLKIQEVISFEELCGSIMTSIFFQSFELGNKAAHDPERDVVTSYCTIIELHRVY